MDSGLFSELQQMWHGTNCVLICATDGGLKDQVGTSSYALFLPEISTPIVTGRAAEWQPSTDASSTRQELLGQLGLEYWLSRLEKNWGRPRHGVKLALITDSQASIDIMANIPNILGIKDVLRPELEVALEVYKQRQSHPWISWRVCKVESHINEEEAPDVFQWECNTFVDSEATKARLDYPLHLLKQRPDYVFSGTIAGCKINGRVINSSMYNRIKEHVNGTALQTYLMEKYHWTVTSFEQIDWAAHSKALGTLPPSQKVTILKYIHGWLATKRRRYCEGYSSNEKCVLCAQQEERLHLFRCDNPQAKGIREMAWKKLLQDLCKDTEASFQAVFQAGLQTVLGAHHPNTDTKAEWPKALCDAYTVQTEIGWEQILFGRIAKQWDGLSQYFLNGGAERDQVYGQGTL